MYNEVGYRSVPLLCGPRGTLEFSDECSLFVTGVSVSALSLSFHLLPGLWLLCPCYQFCWLISFPVDTALLQALLSLAWVISAALFLFPGFGPSTPHPPAAGGPIDNCPSPIPHGVPPLQSPAHAASLLPFNPGPHCCP